MASLVDRLRAWARAFVLGEGVVERSDMAWGHDPAQFAPPEYGEYLATSNAVYACATLRADLLASVPLRLYRNGRKQSQEVERGNLYNLLHKVNPYWTMDRLLRMTEMSMCAWGAGFWFLERGASTRLPPREIWWGKSDRVKVVPHPEKYLSGFIYESITGEQLFFEPHEVIWFRYPNPLDEYSGLSPLAAARLAADYGSAAMKSNKALFDRGMNMAGIIMPAKGKPELSTAQAAELEERIHKRFTGADKAHRWGVLRFEAEMKAMTVTPREAEFTEGLKFAIEEVARAYKVPLDLIGGQRTYANVEAAQKAVWEFCMKPEMRLIAQELTEQLLPMFPGEADEIEFDLSDVEALQEGEGEKWTRHKEQIELGVMTRNEWRELMGLEPLEWGDVWWGQSSLVPIENAEVEPPPAPEVVVEEPPKQLPPPADEAERARRTRMVAYGSDEHTRLWKRFVRRTESHEEKFAALCEDLFTRQRDSVLSRLTERRAGRNAEDALEAPFEMAVWVRAFRQAARPLLAVIVRDAGDTALDDLAVALALNVEDPRVVRFVESRAQRFARHVNETTWDALRAALAEGMAAGESIEGLAERVKAVMGDRIRSAPETIARTEAIGAYNGGTLEGWRQSGVVVGKEWLAALDSRTRPTHESAHGQRVGLDEDFVVGMGEGPHPGAIGKAEEDIQCRCSMIAVLDTE